jgi:hypothetical protein
MSFETFGRDALVRFLRAADAHASKTARVVIIGGAAAALGHGVESATKDIDTWNDIDPLADAFAAARHETGLDVPIGPTGVADAPYEFETRLVRVLPELRQLEVYVPERHDLVLSKALRLHGGDIATIEEIHARHPLDLETLVTRYLEEMDHVIGDVAVLDSKLLVVVEDLFGELAREQARRRLAARIR